MLFDTDGELIDSWGDATRVPDSIHGCAFDADDNIWVVGNNDGIAQKYSHNGELLFQIGTSRRARHPRRHGDQGSR